MENKTEIQTDAGIVRLQVYNETILRVRIDPRSDKTEYFLVAQPREDTVCELTARGIKTARFSAKVDKDGCLRAYDAQGRLLIAESSRSSRPSALAGFSSISQTFFSPEDECLYGFGNVNGVMGIKGEPVEIHHYNCNKRTPFFVSNKGYGILFNETCNGSLTWSNTADRYTYTADCTKEMDYFLLVGSPAEVIAAYRRLTGKAALLAKQTYGYIQSRNRYANQQELLDTARRFRSSGIPLDGIVIDYKWWGLDQPWNAMKWYTPDWPEPEQMFRELDEMNIPSLISVWPDFEPGSEAYDRLSAHGHFLKPGSILSRPGFDASSPSAKAMFWELIDQAVFSKGVSAIWLDSNETESSDWTTYGTPCSLGNSLPYALCYPLWESQAVFDGQRPKPGNKRVSTLSRGAVAGIQRYGTYSWSGDIPPTWEQLRAEIPGILNFHAAGLPWFSTDTGGYFGIDTADPDKRELFLRWLQLSCFSSIMRVHGRDCVKEPWCFGESYEQSIVWYIRLREQLMPYLYTEAIRCAQEDTVMARPLAFDYPEDPAAAHIPDEFMLGPSLLVCPVAHKGAVNRSVYLPQGNWYDFYTGKLYPGGMTHTVAAPIGKIPVFAKEGALIPLGEAHEHAMLPADRLTVLIFGDRSGAYPLLEDDGKTYAYENGETARIPMAWDSDTRCLTLGECAGSCRGLPEHRLVRAIVHTNAGTFASDWHDYNLSAISIAAFSPAGYQIQPPNIPGNHTNT